MNEHDRAFYAEHYIGKGWEVHELHLTIYVPRVSGTTPEDSLELVREVLDDASFDIRVEERHD